MVSLNSLLTLLSSFLISLQHDFLQFGYPSKTRSLVGDAKFETVKNREAKQKWLNKIREATIDSLGEDISEEEAIVASELVGLSQGDQLQYGTHENMLHQDGALNNGYINKSFDSQTSSDVVSGDQIKTIDVNKSKTATIVVKLNDAGLQLVGSITDTIKVGRHFQMTSND